MSASCAFVVQVLDDVTKPSFAGHAGLAHPGSQVGASFVKIDLAVAQSIRHFALHLAGRILLVNLQYQMPPLASIGLCCTDARGRCLELLRKTWEVLCKLEKLAVTDKDCRAWLHGAVLA